MNKDKHSLKNLKPREMAEIKAEYNHLAAKAGNDSYSIEVLKSQLADTHMRMLEVTKEANKRQEIDKLKSSKDPKKEETKELRVENKEETGQTAAEEEHTNTDYETEHTHSTDRTTEVPTPDYA